MRRIIGLILAFLLLMPVGMPIDRAIAQTGQLLRITVSRLKTGWAARSSAAIGKHSIVIERIRAVMIPRALIMGCAYPDTS